MTEALINNVYEITSHFGNNLILSKDGVITQQINDEPCHKLLLYVNKYHNKFYIFSENIERNINAIGMHLSSPIFPVDIYKNNDLYSFYSSSEKKFFSAHPDGSIHINRDITHDWEFFSLSPYQENKDSSYYKNIIYVKNSIEIFLNNECDFETFLNKYDFEALYGIIANLYCMNREELIYLSQSLIKSSKWVVLISKYFPHDIWASHALPAHAIWLKNRDSSISEKTPPTLVGEEFDFLGRYAIPQTGRGLQAASIIEFLVRTIREHTEPRKKVCILATGRNEGIYYLEWISYHLGIGVEDFFIYSNDNIDNSDELLCALHEKKIIHYFQSKSKDGISVQWKAYAHALSMVPEILDYKWTIICDIDEFFVVNRNMFSNIQTYLDFIDRRKVENISIPWCCIGASNQIKWKDTPLMDRFTSSPFQERGLIKSIFQTRFAGNAHSHFPIELDDYHMTYQNSSGLTLTPNDQHPYGRAMDSEADFRMAVFYHYYFKSIEEFLWKSARNRGDFVKTSSLGSSTFDKTQGDFYWNHFETQSENKYPMFPDIHKFKEDFYKYYYKFLSDPKIFTIYNELKKEFHMKLYCLIDSFKDTEKSTNLPDCYKKMLEYLSI